MKKFDTVYFHNKNRGRFAWIMQEFISMGFFYTNMISQESKNIGYVGAFMKEVK